MTTRNDRFHVRAFTAAAISAAVLAGASACTGASGNAGAGGSTGAGSSSSSTPSSAGTVSLSAASASASGPGGGSGTASGAANGTAANASGIPDCGNEDVTVSLGHGGAGMSHAGQTLVFKNVATHACSLHGYPGAAVVGGGKTLVNATRQLAGYMYAQPQSGSPSLVTLQPGQSASAGLEWVANAGEPCYADGSGELVVTPPNTTKGFSLRPMTVGGQGMCAGFEVHPVVSGIING